MRLARQNGCKQWKMAKNAIFLIFLAFKHSIPMNFFVVLMSFSWDFQKWYQFIKVKWVWGSAGPKNGWKRWKMAKIAIFEIFENFFGLHGIPSPWIFLLYWMYIYLGFPKMMSIFQFLMSLGSSGPKKWPPLAQNFFEIFFLAKIHPKRNLLSKTYPLIPNLSFPAK